ncbi:hypothetical protein RhiirA1_464856 [Rhizophagus irregularis]|uniref:Uncharacterized protein n=2 Tax=Rhizophagus irregularis TaxID=588596 RepID=A0A2N1NS44_9GLOM|nr:hypothetical protein RirG_114330 [Rhizophagus irregularis DAOM 197198w]PKC62654.1 hypothetical protein RhiirA1_464856 [Rhizophagus irregularis]GBC19317.1 hypothetical protein GLOIN_2v1776493 [Rhizophagus irregularis DAOM 181602=DAOM 197198]PKK76710.1 hypothetical protein RhiirC2_772188 [Rhizophagus irregularis]UZO04251.1 hypothetical protein OCT59_024642 [Rhizophagus irregularis]
MQTTIFNINFSIFDKKFIPEFITQNEHSHTVDIGQKLDGNEFWPKQYKSPNKVKKVFSKSLKILKRKFTCKICESKNTVIAEESMISKIAYRKKTSTDKSIAEIIDF